VANRPTVGPLVRGLTGRQFLHGAADCSSRNLDVIQLADILVVRIGAYSLNNLRLG